MYSIQHACSLNNNGVDLLLSGDSSGAMRSLNMAIAILKGAVKTTSCDHGLHQASEEAARPICESPLTVPGLQGVPCYVYDHGIMITRTTNESDEMLSLYSAIILFNIALTYHHAGLLGRERLLKRASMYYNMAVQILNKNNDIAANILTMLALNNKAQIHYDQCEYIQCVDCLKELPGIMGGVEDIHSTLSQEHIKGLLLNVMLLNAPTCAQAA